MHHELVADRCRMTIEARSSLHPIRVETTELTGHLDVERTDRGVAIASGARLEVELGGLRSGNPLVDTETRRRIDLRRHPRLTATLLSATPAGDGTLACVGEVTFQDRTERVEGRLEVRDADEGLEISGTQVVDVRRWGLRPPRLLVLKVEPEVRIRLDLRARPADAPG